jgi:hypothetical protein
VPAALMSDIAAAFPLPSGCIRRKVECPGRVKLS